MLAWCALAATWAGLASGQDAIDAPAKTEPAPPAKAAPADPEARAALQIARAARQRAACLVRAAGDIEAAARRLHAATDRPAARVALDRAEAALAACDSAPATATAIAGGLAVGPASVETPLCQPSDPMCSDISVGSIDVVGKVKSKGAGFRRCYDQARRKRPRLSGQLSVRAVLAETADAAHSAPDKVAIESDSIDDPTLRSCIQHEVRALRFAKEGAGSVVRFSLQLQPGG